MQVLYIWLEVTNPNLGFKSHFKKLIMCKKFKCLETAPEQGENYWVLICASNTPYLQLTWEGIDLEYLWLRTHRVFATKKDAKRAGKFIKEFFKLNQEKLNYITSAPKSGDKVWVGLYMDGAENDCELITFDPNLETHQDHLRECRLYRTRLDIEDAVNLITLALEEELQKFKPKYLTVAPESGTEVYYPDFDNPLKFGVNCNLYDHDRHKDLLENRLLFLEEENALRASTKMLRRINPATSKQTDN